MKQYITNEAKEKIYIHPQKISVPEVLIIQKLFVELKIFYNTFILPTQKPHYEYSICFTLEPIYYHLQLMTRILNPPK